MDRAVCIIADMPQEVLHDTGDAIAAINAGVYVADKLVALSDLVAGRVTPRQNESDIVLYKSVGSALQDVVIAQALYERARQQGLGIELPASIVPVSK
jgi:ornithine cyclodeaminase/alanine dehydrogenase-like protein (mu-crystallin family)